MRIGFDAKRIFFNKSGLGNYGRTTIQLLNKYYPEHDYFLYTPSVRNVVWKQVLNSVHTRIPYRYIDRIFPDYWRAFSLTNQIKKEALNIFHGLNNELPVNINKTDTKTVMTVHDLIFLRYPFYYKNIDRIIYKMKSRYSVGIADRIMAISSQTKEDIVTFFNVDPDKIDVVYQSCSPAFRKDIEIKNIVTILEKYKLPRNYILSVGTIEERKNLLSVIKAVHQGSITVPLVCVGRPTDYIEKLKEYCAIHKLEKRVIFLHNAASEDLPALYRGAEMLVYLSVFEGFGLPILEGLYSKIPVLTSKYGCFCEVGGKSSMYADPTDIDEIQDCIKKILNDKELRLKMINDGLLHAQNFNEEVIAERIMNIYKSM